MRVIGIDPGTLNLGFGILDEDNGCIVPIKFGVISISSKLKIENRLNSIYCQLCDVFNINKPDEVAIEEPFVASNVKSAFAIGRSQAIAILVAAQRNLPIFYYFPATIKQQISSYGGSTKYQVGEMVKIHLGLGGSIIPEDAADSLAVANCHINHRHINNLIKKETSQ